MTLYRMLNEKTRSVNQNRWGVEYSAMGPDGVWQTVDAESGNPLKTIQVVYNSVEYKPETGEEVVVRDPNITISTRDLDPFPKEGENWVFRLPESMNPGASTKLYKMKKQNFLREDVLGTCRIYLGEVKQS